MTATMQKAAAPKFTPAECAALWDKAMAARMAAGNAVTPCPMTLTDGVRIYHETEGMCGFAWVIVRPGYSQFAKWMVANDKGSKAYEGGVSYWVAEHGQSVDRKEKHARAFAEVLTAAGIAAYNNSRLD